MIQTSSVDFSKCRPTPGLEENIGDPESGTGTPLAPGSSEAPSSIAPTVTPAGYAADPFLHPAVASYRRRMFLRNPAIKKAQVRHFWLMDVLPTATSLAGGIYLAVVGVRPAIWLLFAFAWILTALGIELGLHRYFTHRSYSCIPVFRRILQYIAILPGQGTVLAWATNHRHHHRFSDTAIDTHSPYEGGPLTARGLWHAHMGWKTGYPYASPRLYARDLLLDRNFIKIDRMYFRVVFYWLVFFGVAGGLITRSWEGGFQGFLLAGVIRLTLTQHFTWAINSVCHWIGRRPFSTRDHSRNNWLLALPTLGGSWHNNHHAFPLSGRCGFRWWQIDPAYWVLVTLKRMGIVTSITVPPRSLTSGSP